AHEYIRYKVQLIEDHPLAVARSPYVGSKPREDIDAAWDHLIRFQNLRFSAEEMHRLNLSSIAYSRGGGYNGMMGVFHQLHCLVR
ncbi:hypothetical protein PG995_016235, partial [Apiospora arundinis]